jgi:ankyrin repeat protein
MSQRVVPERSSSRESSIRGMASQKSGEISRSASTIARKQSFRQRQSAVEIQHQKYESLDDQSYLSSLFENLDVRMFRAGRFLVENQITDLQNFTIFVAAKTGDEVMLTQKIDRVSKKLRFRRSPTDDNGDMCKESVYASAIRKKDEQMMAMSRCFGCVMPERDPLVHKEAHISDELTVLYGTEDRKDFPCLKNGCECEWCTKSASVSENGLRREKACDESKNCSCCNAYVNSKIVRLLSLRDGAGAAPIHIAYLFQHYNIGRKLLTEYPELSQLKYAMVNGGVEDPRMWPYLGENILHMAIAQRNYREVKYILSMKWLTVDKLPPGADLEKKKKKYLLDLLSAKAIGHFFHPDYKQVGVYFGEYPIQFAVCSNDFDILDLFILVDPYSLFITDFHGNNCLHLCVQNNLKEMYNYIIKKAEDILRCDYFKKRHSKFEILPRDGESEENRKVRKHEEFKTFVNNKIHRVLDRALINVFNKEGLSPFTMAAAEGKSDMFHHILMHRKKLMWDYGPVGCFIVCLTHLDTNDESYGECEDDDEDIDFVSKLSVHNRSPDAEQVALHNAMSRASSMAMPDIPTNITSDKLEDQESIDESHHNMTVKELGASRATIAKTYQQGRSTSFAYDDDHHDINLLIHGKQRQANTTKKHGAIDLICRHGHLEMLDIPEVRQIIAIKWERFGFPTFLWRSMFEILRTLTISLIICLIAYSEGNSTADWFAWSLYPITFLWLLFNFVFDVAMIYEHGLDHYGWHGGIRGAARLENITRSLVFVFFTITCVCKFANGVRYSEALTRIFLSLTVLTTWISVYYFLMGFEKSGNFVVIIFNIISQDLPSFIEAFIIILFGFGSAHAALTSYPSESFSEINSRSGRVAKGFQIYFETIWEVFNHAINGQNNNELDSIVQPVDNWPKVVFTIFAAAFNVCIVIIMLNLLIAMMTDTYSRLKAESHRILARERFNMMISFERSLTAEQKKKSTQGYAIMFESQWAGNIPKAMRNKSCLPLRSLFERCGLLNKEDETAGAAPQLISPRPNKDQGHVTPFVRFSRWIKSLLVYYGFLDGDGIRPNFFEMQTIDKTWICSDTIPQPHKLTIPVYRIFEIMKSDEVLLSALERNPDLVHCADEVGILRKCMIY